MSKLQVLAGFHAVQARLRQAADTVEQLYVDGSRRDRRMQQLLERASQRGLTARPVGSDRLDGLAGGALHQGVVALVQPRQLAADLDELLDDIEEQHKVPLLLVLDGVTDPHNLGACLRSADAAGAHAVIAPRDRAVGLGTVVHRVSCGAADSIPYLMVTNLARTLRALQARGIWVVGTDDQADVPIHDVDATVPIAWVMGAEGQGMRRLVREQCDQLAVIPMMGSVESLNVSVAGALCLFESLRQRTAALR